ncbi:ferredoxin--NADP reductase [Telluribacter sp.]|jgi:ring-1,2-phenylacetyl-CoA epoxidase subunit PaaE|uniref:ferredoxin--NADP reductase n=1 Tax=Telluribacter sp. TaxID=1978767 RepID=UPI002E10B036|nr:ferredoxin--NADP reductase [Telluribacter sp.]
MQENTLTLRVTQVVSETFDAKTYVLEATDGQPVQYQAGQFLTFLLDYRGQPVRRSYSMHTAPGVDPLPAVTVKRMTNGSISRYWLDTVKEGDLLKALPPAGRFTLEASGQPRDIVLIAAGSGITPLFALLKQTLSTEPESQVTLLYASRRESETIFYEQLDQWQRHFPGRLRVLHVLSQPTDDWTGQRGRLNNFRIEKWVGTSLRFAPERASFFLCGPFELMRTAEITLLFMGFGKEQIRKENFTIDAPPVPPRQSQPHRVRIRFGEQEQELNVPAYTTVLQAALNAGIPLPYSCKGGRCSACAVLCRSGTLYMSINDVLTERDLEQGWVLTCTAYLNDDGVRIEVI